MHLIPIEFIWDEQTLKRRLNLQQVFQIEREAAPLQYFARESRSRLKSGITESGK